jgi:osmotically inducible protein OsmC
MNTTSIYTAEAEVHGGRSSGQGRTSDGGLQVALAAPGELGGDGGGTNPEQLFAIGYAACFGGALQVEGRRRRTDLGEVTIRSKVHLLKEGRDFDIAVELAVSLPAVADAEAAVEIVRAAHQVCPYSRAIRGNVPVALSANGAEVS